MTEPPAPPDRTAPGTRPGNDPAAAPARVGRYEVTAVLGEGAFGRVYRGRDPKLGREVAIKVPKADALTPDLRERFLREARAAAAVHHPNVCPIYDVETDGDLPYLVMRYAPGGTLADELNRRRVPFEAGEAAAVVRRIALGVAAAHAQKVLHRDLKPANVLWDASGAGTVEVLVTDFGLAWVAGATEVSVAGQPLGTPLYMSPEQARGIRAGIGAPSDVYSLGVILYRLVTGVVPFPGETTFEVLARVLTDEARPPSAVRPGLDPRVDALCARAMAKEAGDRYPSAKAFADALADSLRAPARAGSTSDVYVVPERAGGARAGRSTSPADVSGSSPVILSSRPDEPGEFGASAAGRPGRFSRSAPHPSDAPSRRAPVTRLTGFLLVWALAAGGAAVALVSRPGRDAAQVQTDPSPPETRAMAPPGTGVTQPSPTQLPPTPLPLAQPPPNQPPRVSAESRLVFGRGDRTKFVQIHVADETPAAGLTVAVESGDEGLVPAAGLRHTGAGPTTELAVTPAPGRWGDAAIRVTATDPAGLTGEAVIRVSVPPPGFALAALPNVTVNRGEPVAPVALAVVDESPLPGKVTFTARADGAVLKADGVKVANGRLELAPVKGTTGAATVTVIASGDDGREDRTTFTLTVTPPPLAAGVKAWVAPAGGANLISSYADFRGGANPGTPDLRRGTLVQVEQVRGGRALVTWPVGGLTHRGWLDAHDLTPSE